MTSAVNRVKLRWWPLLVIVLATLVGIAWVRWTGDLDRQRANILSVIIGIVAVLLVLVWWAAFSRLRAWRRVQGGLLLLVCLLGFFGLFRFDGVDGDLLPVFEYRFRAAVVVADKPAAKYDLTGLVDSPQFFGPARDGRVLDPGLHTDWETKTPAELWRRPIGAGWSGFSVKGDYAITQEQRGDDEVAVCLDLATGAERWSHADRAHYDNALAGEGPRATPTIDGDLVFTQGSTGILNCLTLATGKLRWTKNILRDNDADLPEWGVAGSPLILGKLVVVSAGGSKGRSLVAYDQQTGDRVWSGGDAPSHWSSPVLMDLAGRPQILTFNEQVAGHDATSGKVLWRYPWRTGHPHVCLPAQVGSDTVLISSGYGTGSHLIKVSQAEAGEFQVEEVWQTRRLKSKFANVVIDAGFVFGLDDGILTCVDLATGKRCWKGGRYGHGQLLLLGKHLLVMAESGVVVLVEASPKQHRELARLPVFADKTWNPPALAGPYLLLRNDREAACFRLPLSDD